MKKELSFAFKRSIPVLFGYMFLGMAFGLMLESVGYSFLWAFLASLTIYAGSMQFALVGLLSGGASFLTTAVMTLSINSRHIFYGLSFIERFKSIGWKGLYMVFSLTDETYSLICSPDIPKGLDEKKTIFLISLLDQFYWVCGSALGGLLGQFIPFNSEGIEFAMTALFVVIFIEQWQATKNHIPAIVGALCGFICLVLVGPGKFILPSLLAAVALLLIFRKALPPAKEAAE